MPLLSEIYGIERAPLLCPACDGPMVWRSGVRGRFMGCLGYPACKGTAPDPEQDPRERHGNMWDDYGDDGGYRW